MPIHRVSDLIRIRANQQGVKLLYWNQLLKKLSERLVSIFTPIFLFTQGMREWNDIRMALTLAFSFYFVFRLCNLLFLFPAASAVRRFGYRWNSLAGSWGFAGVFLLLSIVDTNVWLMVPAAILFALAVPLYWLPYHSLFVEEVETEHFGSKVGWMAVVERGIAVVGPVVGAVVASTLGFSALFWLGIVVLLLSSIPLFFMQHHDHVDAVSWSELVEWLREHRFRRAAMSFSGMYFYTATTTAVWPLYLFLLLGNLEQVGLLLSLVMVVSVAAAFGAGKVFDRKHSRGLFAIGSVVTAMMWLVRGFLTSFTQVLVIDGIDKVNSAFYWLPYNAFMYMRAKGKEAFSFIVYREVFISATGVLFWGIAIVLVWTVWSWWPLFMMAAVGVLLSQFILESGNGE